MQLCLNEHTQDYKCNKALIQDVVKYMTKGTGMYSCYHLVVSVSRPHGMVLYCLSFVYQLQQ